MSDCIKCANCGAVSFYEGGKTKIHCINCYNALRAENERLREALSSLYEACMKADEQGDLSEYVDGSILDRASDALKEVKE